MTTVFNDIHKSPADRSLYRGLTLPNKMKVLLISDAETLQGTAAMNVRIGSMKDPVEFQGIAHFLEHMLFMGSEKHPSTSYFGDLVTGSGGDTNAYTTMEETNYTFATNFGSFYECLEAWAQFFLAPLFSADATAKEINAVNSEAVKYLNNDFWRTLEIFRKMSNPDSNINKYQVGNIKTLDLPGIRDALVAFHKKWYSSDIMGLVLTTSDTLDNMQSKVEQFFSGIENKNLGPITFKNDKFPFAPERLGKVLSIVPITDRHSIRVWWPVPQLSDHQRSMPNHYCSHLLGHESRNSALQFLIKEGLASD
jgi:insulysin